MAVIFWLIDKHTARPPGDSCCFQFIFVHFSILSKPRFPSFALVYFEFRGQKCGIKRQDAFLFWSRTAMSSLPVVWKCQTSIGVHSRWKIAAIYRRGVSRSQFTRARSVENTPRLRLTCHPPRRAIVCIHTTCRQTHARPFSKRDIRHLALSSGL